jgi:hypothetical protein
MTMPSVGPVRMPGGDERGRARQEPVPQHGPQLAALDRVEVGRRFVEQDELGAAQHRLRHIEAPPLAPGQPLDRQVGLGAQPDQPEDLLGTAGRVRAAAPVGDDLGGAPPLVNGGVRSDGGDPAAQFGPVPPRIETQHADRSGHRLRGPGQQPDQRGLAGVVAAEHTEDLSAADLDRDVPQQLGVAVPETRSLQRDNQIPHVAHLSRGGGVTIVARWPHRQ